jgi:RND superfamily putative drug exporter
MLERLARTCFRRRGRTLLVWIGVLVVVNVVANGIVKADYRANMVLPDSESRDVQKQIEAANPDRAGSNAQIVFTAKQGIDDPAVRKAMEGFFAKVGRLDGVEVTSPYSERGAQQVSRKLPLAFAELAVKDRDYKEVLDLGKEVEKIGDRIDVPGLRIEYGGDMFSKFAMPESEMLGLLAAVIILLVAFGSVLAMGLPIGTALFGLGTGVALTALGSRLQSMPDFAPQMTAMIGLGVGIDYALFIVTRYREGLHAGMEPEDATAAAVDTSGRAVLFAGATVIISLLGLYLMGLGFVQGLATGAALGVLVMMVASITLLPALIGFAGRRVEVTTYRGAIGMLVVTAGLLLSVLFGVPALAMAGVLGLLFIVVGSRTFLPRLAHEMPRRKAKARDQQFWFRWSRVVQHRPWYALVAGLAVLLLLAVPIASLRLGFGDTGNLQTDQTPRRAYDLLAEGFGPGFNGPIIMTVAGDDAQNRAALGTFAGTLKQTDGVAAVAGPIPVAKNLALLQIYATSAPQDADTAALVHRLRDDVVPKSGIDAKVGGFNAASVDFAVYIGSRLPFLIGAVLVLSFVLLMTVFRSLLVPLKAVIMNLLSISAAYGVVVAVFQWGWGASLIGVGREGPIEAWAPMMLFAIVFGLSMDYEVFLLSRMKEEYDRTGKNDIAVADGLAATARVITAAALIMVCVFSAFVLGDDRSLKLFGLGLAIAVLVDATVVRVVLVPATMELLGDLNWWFPTWLDRALPKLQIEGKHAPVPPEAPERDDDPDGGYGGRGEPELVPAAGD